MVLKIPYLFFKSLEILRSDKKIMFFSIIPILIGFLCYYFLSNFVFTDLYNMGENYLKSHFEVSGWISNFIFGLLIILFGIFVNFTFFIFTSIVASPFNDLISSLVEQKYFPQKNEEELGFSSVFIKLPKTLKNELKKISFLILLSFLNILLSFFLPPLAILLAALIFAISFLDYSWSRNELDFKMCIMELRKGFLSYLLGGLLFMFLIAVPILNLFFLPLAVVFFTVVYCEYRVKYA